MQIERLLQMIFILLNEGKTTGVILAERLNVTRRTISRYVDTLSVAGIPIYTEKGKRGGISILPEFTLDKSLLTHHEKNEILASLVGMANFSNSHGTTALEKLSGTFKQKSTNWLSVDTNDWVGNKTDIWQVLKQAILEKIVITFDYYNSEGIKAERTVEPAQLWFKSKDWYLRGFDIVKGEQRIFKLTRIKDLKLTEQHFETIHIFDDTDEEDVDYELETVKFKVGHSCAYRIYDEFDDVDIVKLENGTLEVTTQMPIDNWAISYFLSFGSNLEMIAPAELKATMQQEIDKMLKQYL